MKPDKPKAAEWKKKAVREFESLIKSYPIIGAVNMESLPTKQLQNMRAQLRDNVVLKMSKKRLIKLAIEHTKADKKGIEKLESYLRGMPALLFTKENPFTLYKKIQKNKSPAPAKAGQTAPKDIVVPAGPTPFSPGPIIGELGALKIKTGVENGKVAVKEDCVVVKEGETIKANVASILTRLGIEPMEIGLDLVAVYEGGEIYTKDILGVDEEEYVNNIKSIALDALKLSVSIGYATSENIELMIRNAHLDSLKLAVSEAIVNSATREHLLAKAEADAAAVVSKSGISLDEISDSDVNDKSTGSTENKECADAKKKEAESEPSKDAENKKESEEQDEKKRENS